MHKQPEKAPPHKVSQLAAHNKPLVANEYLLTAGGIEFCHFKESNKGHCLLYSRGNHNALIWRPLLCSNIENLSPPSLL